MHEDILIRNIEGEIIATETPVRRRPQVGVIFHSLDHAIGIINKRGHKIFNEESKKKRGTGKRVIV